MNDSSDDRGNSERIVLRSHRMGQRDSPKFRNPMSWSVGIMRLGSVTIRLHALSMALILVVLFRSIWFSGAEGGILEIGPALIVLVALFWLVLASESIVTLVTRALGGSAGEIILHPLGGLDTTVPPPGWKRQAFASISGLCFLAIFTVLTGIGLAAITKDPDAGIFPNPFMIDRIYEIEMFNSWWLLVLYLFHWASFLVLVANLIPSPPMRSWNCLVGLLRIRLSWQSARKVALRVAIVSSLVIACWALVDRRFILLLFAIFLAECIREEYRRIQMVHHALGHSQGVRATSIQVESMLEQEEARATHARRRAKERSRASARMKVEGELDQILEKISRTGLDSLTKAERRTLRAATDHRLEDEAD